MSVRSLDILDLPFLLRHRDNVLPLDSARLFTRGNPLRTAAMLSYLNLRRHIYTAVAAENGVSLIGQVILKTEETSARMTFLAPAENANGLTLPLLDHLASQAGEWGAFHLLAEVDEDSPLFKSLRQACFAMYAWQRVWKLPELDHPIAENSWREAKETDWPAVQSLHGQIVPALIQPVDALPKQAAGLVCRGPSASLRSAQGDLQAYVLVTSGPEGVWLQPLVPPDSTCFSEQLAGLVRTVAGGYKRPVYVCVRSYQAWLESALEELGAEVGPRQAVMVKRLAKMIKESQAVPVLEKALVKAKPAAPMSRMEAKTSEVSKTSEV